MKYLLLPFFIIASLACGAQVTMTNKFKPNLTLLTVKDNDLKGRVKELTYSDIYINKNGDNYAETKSTVNNLKTFFSYLGVSDSTQVLIDSVWETSSIATRKEDTSIGSSRRSSVVYKAVFNKQNEMIKRITDSDNFRYITVFILDKKNRVVKDSSSPNTWKTYKYKENPDKTTSILTKNSKGDTDTFLIDNENRIVREARNGYSKAGTYSVKEYTYNTKGDINTITDLFYIDNKLNSKRISKKKYIYDDHGNWIFMMEEHDGELPSHISRRTITYWE